MRLHPLKRITVVLAAVALLVSCGDGGIAPPPPGSIALGTGLWYMHAADDSALSTTISERTVGVALERTQLDSAYLDVRADGTYEQRYWLQIFVTGALDRTEVVIDQGTWSFTGVTYAFTSNVRARAFFVEPTIIGTIETLETMVFYTDPPETAGVYRRTRP